MMLTGVADNLFMLCAKLNRFGQMSAATQQMWLANRERVCQ